MARTLGPVHARDRGHGVADPGVGARRLGDHRTLRNPDPNVDPSGCHCTAPPHGRDRRLYRSAVPTTRIALRIRRRCARCTARGSGAARAGQGGGRTDDADHAGAAPGFASVGSARGLTDNHSARRDADGPFDGACATQAHAVTRLLRFLRFPLRAALVCAALLTIGFVVFVARLPRTVDDPASRTDAIVVLTGGSDRVSTGMRLLEAGLARDLLISGVPEAVRLGDIIALEPDVAGRATCCITLGRAATAPLGNAEEAAT